MSAREVHIDVLPVTEDTAVELFIHHAALAAAYFEATPDDEIAQIKQEAKRIIGSGVLGEDTAMYKGVIALATVLDRHHAGVKQEFRE